MKEEMKPTELDYSDVETMDEHLNISINDMILEKENRLRNLSIELKELSMDLSKLFKTKLVNKHL